MSHSRASSGLRTLAFVASLGAGRLLAPAAIQAQSINPEQALLNRTAIVFSPTVETDPTPAP